MRPYRHPAVLFLLALVLASACRDPTDIGLGLIGEGDLLTARTDTFTIRTYTVRGDSTVTSNLQDYLVGSDEDPVFGQSTAGLYTEFRLLENNLNFTPDTGGVSYTADSLVLALRLIGEYGNETVPHALRVLRLDEPMETGTLYYARTDFATLPAEVGRIDGFLPRPADSVTVGDVRQPAQLRIPLSAALADDFLRQSVDQTGSFNNDTAFQAFFEGLFLVPDTAAGFADGFFRVDPDNSFSRLQLYYTASTADTAVQRAQAFVIGTGSARSGRYTHAYAGSEADPAACGEAGDPADWTYVSGLAGLRTVVEIPHLEDLGRIAVNRAMITFPLAPSSAEDSVFPAPPDAYLIRSDSTGCRNAFSFIIRNDELFLSVRDQFEPGSHYDSRRRSVYLLDGTRVDGYQLNVTREVQAILNGDVENGGFLLLSFPFFRSAHRAAVGSATNPDPAARMRIEILYTEVE